MGAWKTNLPFKWHGNCVPVSLSHRLQALRAKICCLNIQHYLLGSQLSLTLNNESNIRLAHKHIEAMVGLSYFRWKSRNTSERITFPVRFYISFYFEKKKLPFIHTLFILFPLLMTPGVWQDPKMGRIIGFLRQSHVSQLLNIYIIFRMHLQ